MYFNALLCILCGFYLCQAKEISFDRRHKNVRDKRHIAINMNNEISGMDEEEIAQIGDRFMNRRYYADIYSFIVYLTNDTYVYCIGSLINQACILTTATCIQSVQKEKDLSIKTIGGTVHTRGENEIKEHLIHSKFKVLSAKKFIAIYDLGVIILKKPLNVPESVFSNLILEPSQIKSKYKYHVFDFYNPRNYKQKFELMDWREIHLRFGSPRQVLLEQSILNSTCLSKYFDNMTTDIFCYHVFDEDEYDPILRANFVFGGPIVTYNKSIFAIHSNLYSEKQINYGLANMLLSSSEWLRCQAPCISFPKGAKLPTCSTKENKVTILSKSNLDSRRNKTMVSPIISPFINFKNRGESGIDKSIKVLGATPFTESRSKNITIDALLNSTLNASSTHINENFTTENARRFLDENGSDVNSIGSMINNSDEDECDFLTSNSSTTETTTQFIGENELDHTLSDKVEEVITDPDQLFKVSKASTSKRPNISFCATNATDAGYLRFKILLAVMLLLILSSLFAILFVVV